MRDFLDAAITFLSDHETTLRIIAGFAVEILKRRGGGRSRQRRRGTGPAARRER